MKQPPLQELQQLVGPDGLIATIIIYRRRSPFSGKDEVLFGLSNHGFTKGYWTFPGGKFESKKDRNYRLCARREGSEETGLLGHNLQFVGLLKKEDGHTNRILAAVPIFQTDKISGLLRPDPESFKQMEWVPTTLLSQVDMMPDDEKWIKKIIDNHQGVVATRIVRIRGNNHPKGWVELNRTWDLR